MNITKKQIDEMISLYESNADSLEEVRAALDANMEIEDGINEAEASFEQGFNNALEKVFTILGIDPKKSGEKETLYDYLLSSKRDFDTMDPEFNSIITTCYLTEDEADDEYDKFCVGMYKLVTVEQLIEDQPLGYYTLLVNWADMIRRNMDALKEFANKHYDGSCKCEDDFISMWMTLIHGYLAGYVPESFYKELLELVENLK